MVWVRFFWEKSGFATTNNNESQVFVERCDIKFRIYLCHLLVKLFFASSLICGYFGISHFVLKDLNMHPLVKLTPCRLENPHFEDDKSPIEKPCCFIGSVSTWSVSDSDHWTNHHLNTPPLWQIFSRLLHISTRLQRHRQQKQQTQP